VTPVVLLSNDTIIVWYGNRVGEQYSKIVPYGVLFVSCNNNCHTAIENLSDPIGYLLDFTNPYYTALVCNMKARAKKDNPF
jgi:hypothetical protein